MRSRVRGVVNLAAVRAFLRSGAGRARVLAGACDDLITPRTFGPLLDACSTVKAALAAGDHDGVLTGMLAELANPGPALLVVEDIHWADDATLDVLRYLGRRVADLPALLLLTYRDEEAGPLLQRVLGDLSGVAVHRLPLRRLSRAAVARLSGGTAVTSAGLYKLTAGNPFFVSEALAAPGEVPATVVDAILARVRRLGPSTQAALEQLAIVPSRVELHLARALLGDDMEVLADAERRGMIEVRPTEIAFGHELARRALESSLPTSSRMQLHARVLAVLTTAADPDLSRLVHHAVGAGDDATVIAAALPAALRANRDTGLRATASGNEGDAEGATARHSLAALALLSVRRGGDDAAELVARAREQARRTGSRYEVVPAAFAEVEHAWALRRPAQAREALEVLHGRTGIEGAERERGALRRWMRRLGLPAAAFPGCPEEFAAGLAGDWRAAAQAWARIGDPYERALELADSGETEPTEEALRIFDDLGARPAAAVVRKRLRDLGVTRIRRGPQSTTRAHPAGLTERQTEVLDLLCAGATNAEIAARLVLSVRTVDHHVSAVLQKLRVTSRREAMAQAGGPPAVAAG